MRQRTEAEFSDLTDALVHRMERGGYAVSVFRMGEYVETARVADGDGEEHLYHCVGELARMVGIEPKGA